jgi:transcriptional regulator
MFRPPFTRVDDPQRIQAFVRDYPFGILITSGEDGAPFATHIPFLVRANGSGAELVGHVAKANPHWKLWDGHREALVIFAGPHGYVSPSWYGEHPAVPTWNYAAVHAYGRPRAQMSEADLWPLLIDLVNRFEGGRESPWRPDLPPDYRAKMLAGIVGVTIPVERWEGKFKLSQNRPEADRERVTARLEASAYPSDRELGQFMRDHADVVYPERNASELRLAAPGGKKSAPTFPGPLAAKRDSIADLD